VRAPGTPALPAALTAGSFLVADARSGAVLAARAPHRRAAPASTLKALTALEVARTLPPGRAVRAAGADVRVECACVGLAAGRLYTVDALVHAMLLRSGNDAANVLASAYGSRASGVAAMNRLAADLQAGDTLAVTPSGLDGPGQSTSAYDLALVVRAGLADPRFRRYLGASSYRFGPVGGPTRTLVTHDPLRLGRYPGLVGGKTGWTSLARYTYVGAASRGGRTYLVTVLGSDRSYGTQARALLDWAFGIAVGPHVGRVGRLVESRSTLALRQQRAAARAAAVRAAAARAARVRAARVRAAATRAPGVAATGAPVRSTAADGVPARGGTSSSARADVGPGPREPSGATARAAPRQRVDGPWVGRGGALTLPLSAQTALSLGAVALAGLALLPGRRPPHRLRPSRRAGPGRARRPARPRR